MNQSKSIFFLSCQIFCFSTKGVTDINVVINDADEIRSDLDLMQEDPWLNLFSFLSECCKLRADAMFSSGSIRKIPPIYLLSE